LDQRLRALEVRVDALQKENLELRRRLDLPPPPTATDPAARPPVPPAIGPSGHEPRLVIGGFTQMQAEFGGTGDPRFAGARDRVYVRRARLFLGGSFAEHFGFRIEGEFGAGSVTPNSSLRAQANEILLEWNRYTAATFRVGQLKPAFSAELLVTEHKGPLIERSLGAERIEDGRQVGAEVAGEFAGGRAGYLVFAGNGSGANSSANDNLHFLETARLFGTAWETAGAKLLVGADLLHSTDAAVAKPGVGFRSALTGPADNLFDGTRDGWGLDAAWHTRRLELSSELLRMRYRPADRIPDASFDAESWQFTAAYFVVPEVFQLAVRREHFDPDKSRPGDSTDNWMTGFNYYLKGDDVRLAVDYLFGRSAGLPDDRGRLLTRFQIVY
jgi:phosphate-selective porin OprO and OprP